jgi:hypothetical protein
VLERLGRAQPGTRNHELNRSAFALGQLVAAGALDETETVNALSGAGLGIGLTQRESERTIASGLSAGMEQPRGIAERPRGVGWDNPARGQDAVPDVAVLDR